jgi:deoxyhypusine synthase
MLLSGVLEEYYEIDLNSWMYAAEKILPIVPGWEDSTMGNIFCFLCYQGELKRSTMKSGIEYMTFLAGWYQKVLQKRWVFKLVEELQEISICVVPMLYQDMEMHDIPFGVISAKFQILQPVMVRIQGQFLTKKITWEIRYESPSL